MADKTEAEKRAQERVDKAAKINAEILARLNQKAEPKKATEPGLMEKPAPKADKP